MSVLQKTLYLTTSGTEVSKKQQSIVIKDPEENKTTIPIHNLRSICVFGAIKITPYVLKLCLKHQVSVHFHSENGYLLGQVFGSGDSRYLVRKAQYFSSEDPFYAKEIVTTIVTSKIQNSRINLLRARRESIDEQDKIKLTKAVDSLEKLILQIKQDNDKPIAANVKQALDPIRGFEGMAAKIYFGVFTNMLKKQREYFAFNGRSRRPPLDRINCLLSYLYALLTSDCLVALSVAGIDPYVGWLHSTRAGRPAAALDLMEEFRPYCERIAVTMINREQIQHNHFVYGEGGAVELTKQGKDIVIQAWHKRKQVSYKHQLFKEKIAFTQLFIVQARILSRYLRKDIPHYVPFLAN